MIFENQIIPREIHEFVIEGPCDIQEVIRIIETRYPAISKGILWNVTAGSLAHLGPADMRLIANTAKMHAVHKKTAYVGMEAGDFGKFRQYETHAELSEVPTVMKVFHDADEALEWLKQ
ncbi:hypothetical protein [Pontiella sp.]|uniref:hypothetical protein n=1 Tax=Pontiella sp. TaxID=2837462 RepID=UPI0035697113